MSAVRQLWALFQKDVCIRKLKRHPVATLIEFMIPIALVVVLQSARGKIPPIFANQTSGFWTEAQYHEALGPYEGKYKLYGSDMVGVLYAPENDYSDSIVKNAFLAQNSNAIKRFPSQSALEKYLSGNETETVMAIYFPDTPAPAELRYTLRFPPLPSSLSQSPLARFLSMTSLQETHREASVMIRIFREHVRYFMPDANKFFMPILQPFPSGRTYVPPKSSKVQQMTYHAVLTLGTLGYMGFFVNFCKNIIEDKESRIRELMRMMGLSDTVYWTSAMCVGLGIGLPLCMISTYQLCGGFNQIPSFDTSAPTLVLTILLFFVIGTLLVVLLVTVICPTDIFYGYSNHCEKQ
ncbi:uncharacterized protein LOC108864342 [Galendromus occidentalis]|uniref:Uncharacterized protein LOC108864342 n=1 Tax=Galendromus occidentalis TaxID=34638 RepID=A0AAJ7L680_9ACAR|nr:uncharacterized protein LOC108864342 [Galendromus occidentalis]